MGDSILAVAAHEELQARSTDVTVCAAGAISLAIDAIAGSLLPSSTVDALSTVVDRQRFSALSSACSNCCAANLIRGRARMLSLLV